MNGKAEAQDAVTNQGTPVEAAKWVLVFALILAGVFCYHYFDSISSVYRVLALVPVVGIAVAIGAKTIRGQIFWGLIKGAVTEARRVVWPTRQEAAQTTMVVIAVIFLMSLVLWGLDAVFGKLVSLVIG